MPHRRDVRIAMRSAAGSSCYVVGVEAQIAAELAEAGGIGQAGEGIFGGDAREIDRAVDEAF